MTVYLIYFVALTAALSLLKDIEAPPVPAISEAKVGRLQVHA